jgi:hypothetical protein
MPEIKANERRARADREQRMREEIDGRGELSPSSTESLPFHELLCQRKDIQIRRADRKEPPRL